MKLNDLTPAERERIATAMHEAGHAVAVVLAGGHVGLAEVYDTERNGRVGHTTHTGLSPDAERAVTYAGPYAEARWQFGPRPRIDQVRAALSGTCDHAELTAAGGGLPREVEPTIEVVWPAIKALGADLFRDGRADHDAVLAALGAASEDDLPMIRSLIKSKTWEPGLIVARA
ncbi:hypothetical protein [Nocardia cyriacigeorgica]|uniref:hypothetical protein n=1 Tax=Nocardia cyriacigeorgica TaxID=135487 RepID=UPI0018960956|nr:hypothetical protein [Nocardia cyriacigeorgica]MBF6161054.1 hypothetical protein [Nocardia cyriacigeorgica]MBF6199853.1 hypothetical protein [Nocardia cyriacigeorgica]